MTNSIQPIISESERIIALACKHFLLKVEPSQIVMTIQTTGRKRAYGWFAPKRWKGTDDKVIHEINLCAEHLREKDMGETILHELAHADNEARGIQDCDKSGRIHNKRFKSRAEMLGLLVHNREKSVGWGRTSLAPSGERFLAESKFDRELFKSFRLERLSLKVSKSAIKCECDCGYTVRVSKKWIAQGEPTCPCGEKLKEVKE